MTDIEQFLFGGNVAHGITEFCVMSDCIRLRLTPWECENTAARGSTRATFSSAKILRLWQIEEPDGEDLNLPWDIIGFDSYELSDGRWTFVMNCGGLEWSWESNWPGVERMVV